MYCQKCGKEIPSDSHHCPECGATVRVTKFCNHCGAEIDNDCVICVNCGKQVAQLQNVQPNLVITNTNTNVNANVNAVHGARKPKNKWVAFLLCLFLGYFGAHRFYEGKIGTGILWLVTGGLLFVGVFFDLIAILLKPNPYYV